MWTVSTIGQVCVASGDEVSTKIDVAAAAPEAPNPFHILNNIELGATIPLFPSPKMIRGSSARFNKFVTRDTFTFFGAIIDRVGLGEARPSYSWGHGIEKSLRGIVGGLRGST